LKRFSAILFLVSYLISTTEANQLLKLNILFEHFSEHRSQDKNLSLIAFFDMHYLSDSPKDVDYDRNMQLPFKTSSDNISISAHQFVPLIQALSIKNPILIIVNNQYIRPSLNSNSKYLSTIWQPPKKV
jgi:hypothetical protein